MLFLSGFDKKKKLIISGVSLLLICAALWFEGSSDRLYKNLILIEEIQSCGLQASHSYRSNYDFEICLHNQSSAAAVRRLNFDLVASDCREGSCKEIQRVTNDLPVRIDAQSETTFSRNVSFDAIKDPQQEIAWTIELNSVLSNPN